VSNTDEPDRKPSPRPPVARNPEADPNATAKLSAEDVARLQEDADAGRQTAQDEDPLLGTLIRDKWKVLERLGAGSFGTVYKVQDVKGGWIEALKILGVDRLTGAEAEEMRARFLREAQIMKRLGRDSTHIVGLSTYEEDIEAGLVYFLMELVEGRSLAAALSEEGPFSVERTVRIALQVCDALMAAHEGPEPVVHRDLKLENLMLTTDRSGAETVKVLDFGIAKIAEREADSRLTTVGTLGTPGYAAPEQLRAEAVDGRTDLFAFGVILYALLTGRDPWLGNLAHEPTHQIYELMVATDRAEVRPMGGAGVSIPPAMVNVVMKLLRRDPAERFQSARELRDTLQAVAGSGMVAPREPGLRQDPVQPATPDTTAPTESTPAPAAPARPRPRPKKKSRVGRVAAALVLIAGGGAVAWVQPWGRTLDVEGLLAQVQRGAVSRVWLTEGGIEGGIRLLPLDVASRAPVPFLTPVAEDEVTAAVERLRAAGAVVDVSWQARRLVELAAQAQERGRYYGLDGADVRSFALRLSALVPDSPEAGSLLLKVGERMAWDAEAALTDGPPERAGELVRECLELIPEHPRCIEVSGALPPSP
jgi:serine/threonine protein kinase